MKNPIMRLTAVLISFALIHVSFGPEAWAQVVPLGGFKAPISGSAAAAAGAEAGTHATARPLSLIAPASNNVFAAPAIVAAPSAGAFQPASAPRVSAPVAARPVVGALSSASVEKGAASAPAAASVAAQPLQTGPLTASVGRRVAARFAELKSFLRLKSAQSVEFSAAAPDETAAAVDAAASRAAESGLSHAAPEATKPQSGGDRAPPAPPSEPEKGKSGWFGLGAAASILLGGLLTMQVGLEAEGAAGAQLVENAFGNFAILAQVSIFFRIGSMIGQQLAPPAISKLGLAKTYYVAHFLRAASIAGMIFLLGSGLMPLSLMYVFYAVNGLMTGVAATADGTIRKILIGTAPGSQEKFRTIWQLTAEVIGVIAPIAFSALVVSMGPTMVTAIYPATIVLALLLLIAKKVLPAEAIAKLGEKTGFTQTVGDISSGLKNALFDVVRLPARAVVRPAASLRGLKDWLKGSSLYKGFQLVWNTPALRYSFLGAATFDVMNVFLYKFFAPGYGKLIAGAAGMSPIAGMVVGLFSLGGLITAVVFLAMQRKLKALASDGEAAEAQKRSVLRWTMLGVPAMLLLSTFALSLPTLGAVVALPAFLSWAGALTVPSAAMIVFGFFQVAASIKLNAFFIDSLPDPKADPANKDKVQQAIAFEGSAVTAISILGMLAMKPMFSDLAAFNPFTWIAVATIPLAVAVFFIQRKLAAAMGVTK